MSRPHASVLAIKWQKDRDAGLSIEEIVKTAYKNGLNGKCVSKETIERWTLPPSTASDGSFSIDGLIDTIVDIARDCGFTKNDDAS